MLKLRSSGALLVCFTVLAAWGCSLSPSSDFPSKTAKIVERGDIDLWPKKPYSVVAKSQHERQIDELIARMSLDEKVGQIMQAEIQSLQPGDVKKYHLGSVLNGGGSMPYRKEKPTVEDWRNLADSIYLESVDGSDGNAVIPIIWGTDAVHGHNNVLGATLFPHNIGLGATRNAALVQKIGEATAKEVRATGIEWVFAPTLAVARNDRWGRTYESYSEDPALVAEFSGAMIEGLQGKLGTAEFLSPSHVVATAKHFLGDGGTQEGDDQGNAVMSESELIAIHNAGYPPALAAGVQTLMSSFSSWNGEKMHGNRYLLTEVLKNRMGFDGFVVGDWNGHGQVPGCTNDSCAQAINAGVDLIMVPYDWRAMIENTKRQVQSGEIAMARLDDAVRRIIRVKIRAGLFDHIKPSARIPNSLKGSVGSGEHRAIARQAVRESLVLLKNRNRLLPLNPKSNVLIVGDGADNIVKQSGGWSITWQGTGLGNDKFPGATSIYAGIAEQVKAAGGNAILSVDGKFTKKPDVAIVVFGEEPYAAGLGDLNTLEFQPGAKYALKLLKSLQKQKIPVVSVFLSGRPLWVNPEINASDAFVAAWLPGSEGAGVADVLFSDSSGKIQHDFIGKLPFSWPKLPLQEQLNFEQKPYDPLFPYSFGLSYQSPVQPPSVLAEAVPGVALEQAADIALYVGRPLQPWNLFIQNEKGSQILSGAFAKTVEGDITLQTIDKDVQEDALQLSWQDASFGKLTFLNGKPMNLAAHVAKGVLTFDLNVKDIYRGGIDVIMNCKGECERLVPITDFSRTISGKGWQPISLALSCFYRQGDDFSSVPLPFSIAVGGKGEIQIANVRIKLEGQATTPCPDMQTVSTTPAMLTNFWALDWWENRHQEKLAQLKTNKIDVLMIGDSITHYWEEVGLPVWNQFLKPLNAFNLGFSGDRTENVLWRLEHGEVDGISPKVAVLLIGTNNTGHRLEHPDTTFIGIEKIVKTLRAKLPSTKILVLSVFPRDAEPNAQMRTINDQINIKLLGLADGKYVHTLNINSAFLDKDGNLSKDIMPDLLHLNERGYRLWADAMLPTLQNLLQP